MKLLSLLSSIALIVFGTVPAFAQEESGAAQGSTEDLTNYVKYLSAYLGYDVTQDPSAKGEISENLIDKTAIETVQKYLVNSFLGAIPVSAINEALTHFVPGDSPLNQYANTPFKNPAYNSTQGPITANALVDQKTYQNDPVSQGVLNILATPSYTECQDYYGVWVKDCEYLYDLKVLYNVIGTLPSRDDASNSLFSYNYNRPLVSQLNSNILLSPLVYSTTPIQQENGAAAPTGLVAQNQAESAANFIRYAGALVSPVHLPRFKDYYETYNLATTEITSSTTAADQEKITSAQLTIGNYFTDLRVYAAQASVAIGNLYYILAKRMPQPNKEGENSTPSSQALNEFNMATWRILPPSGSSSPDTAWLNKINNASAATVQKEIAILLAEMNYQMYLSRQQDERILLTNSMLLVQGNKINRPEPFSYNKAATEGSSTTE